MKKKFTLKKEIAFVIFIFAFVWVGYINSQKNRYIYYTSSEGKDYWFDTQTGTGFFLIQVENENILIHIKDLRKKPKP